MQVRLGYNAYGRIFQRRHNFAENAPGKKPGNFTGLSI
jgi:hypothetical protein